MTGALGDFGFSKDKTFELLSLVELIFALDFGTKQPKKDAKGDMFRVFFMMFRFSFMICIYKDKIRVEYSWTNFLEVTSYLARQALPFFILIFDNSCISLTLNS